MSNYLNKFSDEGIVSIKNKLPKKFSNQLFSDILKKKNLENIFLEV